MSGQRLLHLWTCAIITLLVQTSTAEVCDKPTSQVTPRTSQLTASSTASGLSVEYGVYDCCNTLSLGGWCHATNRSDEWYDVRFTSAVNVTVVVLQKPYIAAGASPPTVTQFRLLYEDARDQFDVLTKYTHKNNGTDQEVIDAVYSNGQFILNLSIPVIARRIRIIVVNYIDRPCLRLDIRGCPVDMAPPDNSIPKVRFDPASSSVDLRLLCSASTLSYFAVDYLVTWYRNTEKVLEEKLTDDALTSYLNVTADNFSSRQTHKCHVQACYRAFCSINATYSNGNSSYVYVPDIEITNTESLVLREGETTYVKVHATAPPYLLCTTAGQQLDCDITIVATSYDNNATICQEKDKLILPHLLFSNNVKAKKNDAVNCEVLLTNNNWNLEQFIAVTLNSGVHLNGPYYSTIKVEAKLDNTLGSYNKTIGVNATFERQTSVCESTGISHLRTFQGSRYDNNETGEFVFYKHTLYPYEVRIFNRECAFNTPSQRSCTCAVAVRINEDVVLLKGCQPGEELEPKLFRGKTSDQFYVRRYDGGRQFDVILPTGGRVVIQKNFFDSINIWIYPSVADVNSTTGLCGSFGPGSRDRNFTTADVNSWRITGDKTKSYYHGRCPEGLSLDTFTYDSLSQCPPKITGTTKTFGAYLTCDMMSEYYKDADITEILHELSEMPGNCVIGDTLPEFTLSKSATSNNATAAWNTTTARSECEKEVNSSIARDQCPLNLLEDADFNNCVLDIMHSGLRGYSQTLVQVFVERCEASYGQTAVPESVLNVMCANSCSHQGFCIEGSCDCSPGFTGTDCSISSSIAPTLFRLDRELCNSLLEECQHMQTVNVFGGFFSTEVKCHYQKIEVNENGYNISGDVLSAPSTVYISSSQISCTLPSPGDYLISINNSRGLINNSLIFITYNPVCMQCYSNGKCSLKASTCYISGQCFNHLDLNPDNLTLFCNATNNVLQWSKSTDSCLGSTSKWTRSSNSTLAFLYTLIDVRKDEISCRNSCLANSDLPCRSYDYNFANKECRVFKYSSKLYPDYLLSMNEFVHEDLYCSNDFCQGQEINWSSESDISSGNILKVINDTWTLSACHALCLNDVKCSGVNFLNLRGICITVTQNVTLSKLAPGWVHEVHQCLNESSSIQKDLVTSPLVTASFVGPNNDTFNCNFQSLPDPLLKYNVIWAINGLWSYEDSVTLAKNISNKLQYNDTVQCAVSVYKSGETETIRGPLIFSDIYRVEIEISSWKDLTLDEGAIGDTVKVKATAPPYVLCRHLGPGSESCQINIEISTTDTADSFCPNGSTIPQAAINIRRNNNDISLCRIQLTNEDWQSIYTINVKATIDHIYDGDHVLTLNLTKAYMINGTTKSYQQLAAHVSILDKDTNALCSSVNDPHVITFDGKLMHNFMEGEFVFYRHTTLQYEIRTFYRACAKRASCNCAVAARAGDDVIVIDKCGPFRNSTSRNFFPMTVKLFRNGALTPGFRILSQYEGREYQIIFPTGTILYVDRSAIKAYNYIDIWLKPSPGDIGSSTGLCGRYDGNSSNDLMFPNGTLYAGTSEQPIEYFKSWRVTSDSDTIYTGYCNSDESINKQITYCHCDKNGEQSCGYGYDLITCPYLETGQTDITDRLLTQALYPLKCFNMQSSYTLFPSFEYNPDTNLEVIDTSKPTASGTSNYVQSKKLCDFTLNTFYPVVTQCSQLSAVRLDLAISSCALDLYVSEDTSWYSASVQNILTQCQIEVERNTSLWEGSPKSPSASYTDLFCIANCGFSGTCVKGICQCKAGYNGSDCFVEQSTAPVAFYLSNGGQCDTRDESCDNIIVYNNNTVNSPKLLCRILKMMTNETGTYLGKDGLIEKPATFLSVNELSCPVSGPGTYQIQISNDGSLWSEALYYFAYDSLCYNCFVQNQTCFTKKSSCLIGDSCYDDGQYNPLSPTQYCNVSLSSSTWQESIDSCEGLNVLWMKEKGYIKNGTVITGSIDSCKQACLNTSGVGKDLCLSFDYNSTNQQCSLNSVDDDLYPDEKTYNYMWLCENRPCPTRNITWLSKPGFTIIDSSGITKNTSSIVECRNWCLKETNFLCRSIQLISDANQCTLSPLTSATAKEKLVRWPGFVFQEWSCGDGNFVLPVANPNVSISKNPSSADDNSYTLSCSFDIFETNDTQIAEVEFLIEDEVMEHLKLETVQNKSRYSVFMNNSKLVNLPYGTKLSCGIDLCIKSSCERTKGGFRRSQMLTLEIKVMSAPSLVVVEGKQGEVIQIKSSFPPAFMCNTANSTSDCSIMIKAAVDENNGDLLCPVSGSISQLMFSLGTDQSNNSVPCGVEINSKNWEKMVVITVVAKIDNVQDGNQTRLVNITGIVKAKNNQNLWISALQKLTITAVNQDTGAVCISMNDPYIVTFDGRYYEMFYEGEYIIYAHTELPYEVRSFYRRCNKKILGSCTCAVAVKSVDDVIVIDRCGASSTASTKQPINIKLYQKGDLTLGTSVRRIGGGFKYEISIPTGTVIEVDMQPEHLNVLIIPSAYDFNRTKGLCGVYNGDKDVQLLKSDNTLFIQTGNRPDPFSISWRVKPTESIYSGYCGSNLTTTISNTLCQCKASSSCNQNGDIYTCDKSNDPYSYYKGEDITMKLQKRALPPLCNRAIVFEYSASQNAGTATWPTPSNYTESFAKSYCAEMINRTGSVQCSNLLAQRYEISVSACVKDIQLSDDLFWAKSSLSVFTSLCRLEYMSNIKLWQNSTTINQDVINSFCFNSCSNNGNCSSGSCKCSPGFGLADCSLNITISPLITSLANNGLCDITTSRCDAIQLFGATFAYSDTLICKLQQIELLDNTTVTKSTPIYQQADYFSFNDITCVPPVAGSYQVQVSNNNQSFSDVFIFTLYHPQCHRCSASGVCRLLEETCFIDNSCYAYGAENPVNYSLVCDNYQSVNSWSRKEDYPYVKGKPQLSTRYNESTNEFLFQCEFFEHARDNVYYFIEWQHNNQTEVKRNVSDIGLNSTVVTLTSISISHFGFMSNVSCILTACFKDNCSRTLSPQKISNLFSVEIKIVPQEVFVIEGSGTAYIQVSSNVPPNLLCQGEDSSLCSVYASLTYIKSSNELLCPSSETTFIQQLSFPYDVRNKGEKFCSIQYLRWPGILNIPVVATLDSFVDGDVKRSIEVSIRMEYNSTLESKISIGRQEVKIIDRDQPTLCGSVNDPHITTFDKIKYDVFKEGEFTLYKHATLPYEVHVFYRRCNERAACNCAVTVKSGNDVILIDKCGPKMSPPLIALDIKVFRNRDFTPNTQIIQQLEGRKYTILLPTGMQVKVIAGNKFLNVWLQASALDFNNSLGLCGNANGDAADDFLLSTGEMLSVNSRDTDKFSLSWRVNPASSHYRGVCETDNSTFLDQNLYCFCSSQSNETCSRDFNVLRCPLALDGAKSIQGGVDVTANYINGTLALSSCNVEEFEYDANYTSPIFSWTNATEWTEEKAANFCINYLTSSQIGQKCSNISSDIFNKVVESCVTDIKIMGHTDYAVEALASLFEQCLSIVGRSVNLWIDNKPDRSYLDALCLNNCNNNGNCTNGICECRSGFIGIDCSINSTTPPAINNMVPSSCDVLHDKCDIITLIGGPFADTKQLICIFEEINYFGETNFSSRNRTERVLAKFTTYEKISCTIPYKASFKVTVQNTENISSSSVIYQIYSSECFNCNLKTCTIWPNYCFITNVCYKVTQSNSSNPDLVCDPEKSRSDWTDRKDFPKIDAKPQVKTQFNLNSSDFVFVCDWAEYRNNNSNITVWAQWYIDDNFVLESQVQSNDSNHQVSHRSMIGLNYTSKIYCGLVACNVNMCNKSRSPIIRSPDFNLQIKIEGSTSLTVTEGAEDRVFRMASNFPPLIFCDQNKTTDCNMFISLKVVSSAKDIRCPDANNVLPQLVVKWSSSVPSQQPSCGVVFTNSNWQLVQTVYVRAVVDGLIDGDQTRYIEVSAHLTETYIVAVETITVKILDSDKVAICQSINDPHMTTFDGMYYNNFNVGEFILYRHTTLPQQVHAYYRKCNNNKASCNCAVVVRSGKQVFRLDRCGPTQNLEDRLSPIQVDMINDGPQSPDLMIVRFDDGKKYEITFVTGTKVVVTVGRKYINIVIQASSYDYGNSEGLCGSFDKNSANDLMIKNSKLIATDHDTFSLSWRVKQVDSMFGGFCGTLDTVTTTDTYCTCGNISACNTIVYKSNCQAGLKNIFRGIDITTDLYATALQPSCAYKFEYDTNYVPQVPTWPTANFTEASARQYCENSIRSTISGPACLGNVLQSVDFEYLIKGCMEDILIFDSTEFFLSTLDNLNMRCLINLQVDLKYWIIESNQVYINKSLVGNICPEDCNNKGQCKEGICVCNQNFSGPACDIDIRKPPTVIDVGDKRICDSNIQICQPEFHIYGENFLNNLSLTCHLKQITIVNKTIHTSDQVIKVAAKFINLNKVICLVNKSLSYAIAISNDGMLISSYYNYWLYNSTCVSCTTKPEACTVKTDTCFIDNTCYMFNQTSPYKDSETCQPASSQTSFTTVKRFSVRSRSSLQRRSIKW